MQKLAALLKSKLENAQRIAVIGVGSELRADDAAGILAAKYLQEENKGSSKLQVFFGGTAPENLSGEIKKFNPTHIIIIDSADTGQKPGTIMLINPEDAGGISFSTHMMPLAMLADYFKESLKCETVIIGIQPKTLKFGECVSKEVKKSSRQVSSAILFLSY